MAAYLKTLKIPVTFEHLHSFAIMDKLTKQALANAAYGDSDVLIGNVIPQDVLDVLIRLADRDKRVPKLPPVSAIGRPGDGTLGWLWWVQTLQQKGNPDHYNMATSDAVRLQVTPLTQQAISSCDIKHWCSS